MRTNLELSYASGALWREWWVREGGKRGEFGRANGRRARACHAHLGGLKTMPARRYGCRARPGYVSKGAYGVLFFKWRRFQKFNDSALKSSTSPCIAVLQIHSEHAARQPRHGHCAAHGVQAHALCAPSACGAALPAPSPQGFCWRFLFARPSLGPAQQLSPP